MPDLDPFNHACPGEDKEDYWCTTCGAELSHEGQSCWNAHDEEGDADGAYCYTCGEPFAPHPFDMPDPCAGEFCEHPACTYNQCDNPDCETC